MRLHCDYLDRGIGCPDFSEAKRLDSAIDTIRQKIRCEMFKRFFSGVNTGKSSCNNCSKKLQIDSPTPEECVDLFKKLLIDVVSEADPEVVLLSGGVDSSLLAALSRAELVTVTLEQLGSDAKADAALDREPDQHPALEGPAGAVAPATRRAQEGRPVDGAALTLA